jgi:hypothetical protein
MDYLDIVDSHGRRRRIGLDRPRLLIGREPSCDIHLSHPNVSRRHAQLQRNEQGRWLLQDLNSLNHVLVEDHAVKQIVLEPGKTIRIAEYWITLKEDGAEAEGETTTGMVEEGTEAWTGLEPGWLEQLQLFQRALLRVEEPRLVLERLAAEFTRIVQPQLVAVGLASGEQYQWEVTLPEKTGANAKPSLQEAAKHLQPEDSDVQMWNGEGRHGDAPGLAAPLCLLFPIKGRSTILGHVFVQRPRFVPLPSAIQRYLTLLTTYAGLVWDNFHLTKLRVAQKELEQELRQARQIQIDLFPPTFEVDERLAAFGVNLPSVQVSGDFYDLFRTGPDTVAFVIADAMGHGMPAALMMAAVRASVRLGVFHGMNWEALFAGLDDIITQGRAGAFVTGLLGEIDLRKGEMQLASAGHLPPSIVVDGQPVRLPEECQTRPWGLKFDYPWRIGRLSLGAGDWSILCFTDGISEAAQREDQPLGTHLVADYHLRNCHLCAEDLCQGLLSEVSARQEKSSSLVDDQTVLVLRSHKR